MVLSDELVVRGYSCFDAWKPGPMRVQYGDLLPSSGLQEALAPLVSFRRRQKCLLYLRYETEPVRADLAVVCSHSHSVGACKMSFSARV